MQHISLTLADIFSPATLSRIFDRPDSIDPPDNDSDDEKPEPGTQPNDE